MTIIRCSECGREYSDKAKECPNCACPTEYSANDKSRIEADCAIDLYQEVITLGDLIYDELEKKCLELDGEISEENYDMVIRLSMYLITLLLFDGSKYNSDQINILHKVWFTMATNLHKISLKNIYKTDKIYNINLDELEKLYLERVKFCDSMFTLSEEKSALRFVQTPALIFTFDFVAKKYLDMSEIMEIFQKNPGKNRDRHSLEVDGCVLNCFFDYLKNNNLSNAIEKILKKY